MASMTTLASPCLSLLSATPVPPPRACSGTCASTTWAQASSHPLPRSWRRDCSSAQPQVRPLPSRHAHALRVAAAAEEGSSAEVLTQEQAQGAAPASSPEAGAAGLPAYKHILLPVMDRNPHLNEATRQALGFGTALAKANNSNITVVVIDEDEKEDSTDHQQRLASIRFYLSQGGFSEYGLLERLGEGSMPAAVVGEVADDLELDLVVMSMEAVHHKHIDCNLLAEFTPCPVLLLPL